jgi:hypothetical protein
LASHWQLINEAANHGPWSRAKQDCKSYDFGSIRSGFRPLPTRSRVATGRHAQGPPQHCTPTPCPHQLPIPVSKWTASHGMILTGESNSSLHFNEPSTESDLPHTRAVPPPRVTHPPKKKKHFSSTANSKTKTKKPPRQNPNNLSHRLQRRRHHHMDPYIPSLALEAIQEAYPRQASRRQRSTPQNQQGQKTGADLHLASRSGRHHRPAGTRRARHTHQA